MFDTKILSLDIGSKNTKIVLGIQKKKSVIVEKVMTIPTPVGCYIDGKILDVPKFKSEILDVLLVENIKCRDIIITTKSTTIITRDIEAPLAKKEYLDSIIRFQMEKYLPIRFDDYVMQYKLLEEFEQQGAKMAKVTVVVYPKTMSEGYFNLINQLKGTPVALDISSNSINKLFIEEVTVNNDNNRLEDTVAVIDLGHDFINVNIINGGNVKFTRIVTSGGSNIDIDIAGQLSISEKEAEEQKINYCNLELDTLSDTQGTIVNDIVKAQLRNWTQEIEKLFNYYKTTGQGNKIDKIYIHGGSSNLKGIEAFIKKTLNLPVIKIKSMSNINDSKINVSNLNNSKIDAFGKELSNVEYDLSMYLNAIGALIRLR